MGRLSRTVSFALIALGLCLCVALAPVSNWSFKNDLLRVQSEFIGLNYSPAYSTSAGPFPPSAARKLLDPDEIRGEGHDARFARALGYAEWGSVLRESSIEESFPASKTELRDFCEDNPDDVVAQAQLLRLMFQYVGDIQETPKPPTNEQQRRNLANKREWARFALTVASQGEQIDPDNAFWTVSQGILLWSLGDESGSLKRLNKAARMARYEDYLRDAYLVNQREFERRWGYRGESMRILFPASVLLPQFSRMKPWFKAISARPSSREALEERWQVFQLCYMLSRESSTLIQILVANAGMRIAAVGPGMPTKSSQDAKDRERARQKDIDAFALELSKTGLETQSNSVVNMAADVQLMTDVGVKVVDQTGNVVEWEDLFRASWVSSAALLAVFAMGLSLALFAFWSKLAPEGFERVRHLAGFGFAFLAIAAFTPTQEPESPMLVAQGTVNWNLTLGFLCLAASAVCAKWSSVKVSLVSTWVVAGVGLAMATLLDTPFGFGIMAVGVAGVLVSHYRKPTRWPSALLGGVLVLGVVATVAAPYQAGFAPIGLLAAAAALCCLFTAKRVALGASTALLLASLGYLAATAYGLRQNAELRSFYQSFTSEADHIRSKTGLPRLSD